MAYKLTDTTSVSKITGTAEPHYGPSAFHSVKDTIAAGANPYGPLTRQDLEWRAPWGSHVETQTFYFTAKTGHYGFIQVIHSNPVGLMFTAQFTCRVCHDEIEEDNVWCSAGLDDFEAKGTEFNAHKCVISLNEAADTYVFQSTVNKKAHVDVTVKRTGLGFKIGKTGTSTYGTDPSAPWGSMFHGFWPECAVSGTLTVKGKAIQLDAAPGMYVMAFQGMKPHHAAARWNFVTFHSKSTSVVVMEFTTPASYGSCTVGVAGVTRNGQLLFTAADVTTEHLDAAVDKHTDWPVPARIAFTLKGPEVSAADDSQPCTLVLDGAVGRLVQRIDVMAEIPAFVKKVIASIAGARPFIYQFSNKQMKVTLTMPGSGEVLEEEGHAFIETTFIN